MKHCCYRVITERLLVPEHLRFRLLPGMPMGDEGTAYTFKKKVAQKLVTLDRRAGGQAKMCRLLLWRAGNRWKFKDEPGWDWCIHLRKEMRDLGMSTLELSHKRKVSHTLASHWFWGKAVPSRKERGAINHMLSMLKMHRAKRAAKENSTETS